MNPNPYAHQIARLEEELEAMRQRAEAAEAALGMDQGWFRPVAPLSLYQTRILRVLLKRDVPCNLLAEMIGSECTSTNSVRTLICRMRQLLPENIVPPTENGGRGSIAFYTIPDRPALAEFLASGVMPMARAA